MKVQNLLFKMDMMRELTSKISTLTYYYQKITTRYILVYKSKDSYKVLCNHPYYYNLVQSKVGRHIVLYNATALWHAIGLIEVVMACYGQKSKFADACCLFLIQPSQTVINPRTAI